MQPKSQILYSIVTTNRCFTKSMEKIVQNNIDNNGSVTIKDDHIIRRTRILSINKLTVRKLYSTLISNIENKPTSQIYFEKMFPCKPIKWDEIYLLPREVTYNKYLRCFQTKILSNILYLNNKLYTSKLSNRLLCSFCKYENEYVIPYVLLLYILFICFCYLHEI